jgi:Ca-activated chloride channel family protein
MDRPSGPKLTVAGKIFVFLFVVACLYGAYRLFTRRPPAGRGSGPIAAGSTAPSDGTTSVGDEGRQVRIGIAYGTEKERWLQWAVKKFAETREGRGVRIDLIPKGSLEGAQSLLAGDTRIHVWSPASALYRDLFLQEWQVRHGGRSPILREENLALSPMVFVFWAERHQAFIKKYGEVSFKTLSQALAEPGGWQGIAGKPEWGLFKLGHTHPNESNSGLMTLVLLAYDYRGKTRGLELADILDPGFQEWAQGFERGVSGLANSTGNLMREMVLKGPSAYDAVFVYENVAIDYLKNAEGRWGELRIVYPQRNLWNENPFYVVATPWSSAEQQEAASRFLDFLLSEPIQRESLVHGFRPGNPAVPVRFAGSPFLALQRFGLSVDLGTMCEPPKAEVLFNLLQWWQRSVGST